MIQLQMEKKYKLSDSEKLLLEERELENKNLISNEDVFKELALINKIEQGLNDIKGGNIYSTEEIKELINSLHKK